MTPLDTFCCSRSALRARGFHSPLAALGFATTSRSLPPPAGAAAPQPPEFLLVGLGNPGERYAHTRHNAGALALAQLVADQPDAWGAWTKSDGAEVALGVMGEPARWVAAALPQSFMNLSGSSVRALARRLGLPAERVIVLHDDLDLPPGKVKVKSGGSSGGHRGVSSCEQKLQRPFWRVRLGIGRPAERAQVADFVLEQVRACLTARGWEASLRAVWTGWA